MESWSVAAFKLGAALVWRVLARFVLKYTLVWIDLPMPLPQTTPFGTEGCGVCDAEKVLK